MQRGLVHFRPSDLHTDPDGTAHGLNPYITTCENPRGGYHITGKDMEVYPGDKIVIHKAVLWLGAAAVFYLPLLVIPLRSLENQRGRAHWFPEVGYDSYEGAWIKIQIPFGKDQYYYGYYIVNYLHARGLGLGYVGFYASKKGRRSVEHQRLHDQQSAGGRPADECSRWPSRRISPSICASNFQFAYQSNYGPLDQHSAERDAERSDRSPNGANVAELQLHAQVVGGQSSSNSFTFTDTRQFNQNLNQTITYDISDSSASFGGINQFSNQSEFDYLLQYTTSGADYQMEFDKIYAQEAVGINKIPEFEVRPTDFFQHFIIPLSAATNGRRIQQSGRRGRSRRRLATWRGDANLVAGPDGRKSLRKRLPGNGDGRSICLRHRRPQGGRSSKT